ncbi:MAG: class I SAM-dependent methyltransferase [Mycobacterium sp.]
MTQPRGKSADQAQLHQSLVRQLYRRSGATGQIQLPAVPGLIDEYVTMCDTLFAGVGRKFTAEELAHLRELLADQLAQAYAASPRSMITISYNAPSSQLLNYHIKPEWWTIEGAYENWIGIRQPPYFGTEPDARVVALASEAPDPRTFRVLDVGAGTGRNALGLARRGFPVDAVELTPKFADIVRTEVDRQLLDVRVIQRDVFATLDDLRRDYQLIVLSEVVSDFRTTQQLRGLFELATHCLAPGGRLLFNAYLAHEGYTPDDATRELGQQSYTSIFTRDEMATAAAGLPLTLLADDSVHDYEKEHLPDGAWPPTSWYPNWTAGQDVFDLVRDRCPIDMRWLVYQKAG